MNNVQQAIRDAAEKGGYRYRYRWWKVNDLEHSEGYHGLQLRALSEHLHDPDFRKALATAQVGRCKCLALSLPWVGRKAATLASNFVGALGGRSDACIRKRAHRAPEPMSSMISARNLPCSAVMRTDRDGEAEAARPGTARIEKECAVLCLDLGLVGMTIDHRVDVVGGLGVKLGQNV